MGDHQHMLQAREAALKVSEAIQRQVGDAFAWLVLRSDPRVISPLFAARSHQLPDQVGLSGPPGVFSWAGWRQPPQAPAAEGAER